MPPYQTILKRLAMLALAVHAGGQEDFDAAGVELGQFDPDVLEALLVPSESAELESHGRTRLLRLLAADPRSTIRRHLVEHLGQRGLPLDPDAEALLRQLAHDGSPVVRRTFGVALGAVLQRWEPLDRSALVAEWTTSAEPELRLAVARALCRPFFALGVPEALDLLSRDDDPLVRHAAGSAMRLRQRKRGPQTDPAWVAGNARAVSGARGPAASSGPSSPSAACRRPHGRSRRVCLLGLATVRRWR